MVGYFLSGGHAGWADAWPVVNCGRDRSRPYWGAGGELKGCRRGMKFFGEMGWKYLEISEICCNFASLLGIKCARAGVNLLWIRRVVCSYGVNENINN